MPKFVLDITVSVVVEDAEDFRQAERLADELEMCFLEAAEPRRATFWTRIEEDEGPDS